MFTVLNDLCVMKSLIRSLSNSLAFSLMNYYIYIFIFKLLFLFFWMCLMPASLRPKPQVFEVKGF